MAAPGRGGLNRRLALLTVASRRAVAQRQELRERAAVWEIIRPALDAARIDPGRIENLWSVATAAKRLADLGDTAVLACADAAFIAQDATLAVRTPFCANAAARAANFRAGPPPRDGMALIDWYAWALAQSDTGAPPPDRRTSSTSSGSYTGSSG